MAGPAPYRREILAAPGGLAVELSNAAKWGLRARYYAQVKGGAGYLRVVPTGGEVLRRH